MTKIFLGMAVHAMPRQNWKQRLCKQRAKKVVSNSPGLVDFAIGPVNPGLDLPKGQLMFFGKFKLQKNCNQCCSSKFWGGYVEDYRASTYTLH